MRARALLFSKIPNVSAEYFFCLLGNLDKKCSKPNLNLVNHFCILCKSLRPATFSRERVDGFQSADPPPRAVCRRPLLAIWLLHSLGEAPARFSLSQSDGSTLNEKMLGGDSLVWYLVIQDLPAGSLPCVFRRMRHLLYPTAM